MRIYTTEQVMHDGTTHTNHFGAYASAVLDLIQRGWVEVSGLNIAEGLKAEYRRETDGLFGAARNEVCYISTITLNDYTHAEDIPALETVDITA